jgi:endoglucanase
MAPKQKIFFLITVVTLFCSCKKETQKATETPAQPITFAPATATASADFKGVNWADERDNFADDNLVLSGTTAADSYATIQTKANTILAGFKTAGANTVRLPVNPSTVSGSWWQQYKGAIDKASELGMKVVLAYWEGASSKDGEVDNTFSYWKMWDTVTTAYSTKGNIYFEVMNEPHGYSLSELNNLYHEFLSRYATLPRARIILDGAGYATDVNGVGADSRFDSCLLSFHFYTWFDGAKETTADWEQTINALSYPARTIVTEFGVPMTSVKDYLAAPGTDREVAYLQGMTNAMHDLNIGGIYWPGLRTNDSYSMFTQSGSGIVTSNTSGLSRLRYAWNEEDITAPYASFAAGAWYKVINKNSAKSLDVNNSSVDDGGSIIQWEYWGGNNQQWQFNALGDGYFSVINKNSGKALDIDNASADAGKNIVQWSYADSTNQQWQIIDIGFGYYKIINKKSDLSLDVNGQSTENGGNVIQWYWNGGANQQWQLTGL